MVLRSFRTGRRLGVWSLTLAFCLASTGIGHTRYLFWPNYGPMWNSYPPFRFEHNHSHKRPAPTEGAQSKIAARGPLQIIISIADQRISLYENGALIVHSSVSTGIPAHPTPLGIFSVISKQRWHRSNIYSAAPMPYMQRITWSGIALHAGELPGHPASHGCIRLHYDFAIQLWHLTKRGTRVIIAQSEVEPIEVTSPHLFAPKPNIASGPPTTAVDAAPKAMAEPVKAAAATAEANLESKPLDGVQAPDAHGSAPQKRQQISVFVSRKEGRLYVRKGFAPLFDAPVTIRDPERRLGTHVFTAMAFDPEDLVVRWTVVSLPEGSSEGEDKRVARRVPAKSAMKPAAIVRTPDHAIAALDRIEIPNSAIDRIFELLTPGSSLIVSDQGISNETGPDTDFIVLTPK
jgi:hypothetical protein